MDNVDIVKSWESVEETVKKSANENRCYYDMKRYKSLLDGECSKLLY